jgi:hypothetical protein
MMGDGYAEFFIRMQQLREMAGQAAVADFGQSYIPLCGK